MSRRALFLDEGFGERRGVVTLDGRPERLLIERDGSGSARLGARFVARVTRIDRASALAFLDLGSEEAVLNLEFGVQGAQRMARRSRWKSGAKRGGARRRSPG